MLKSSIPQNTFVTTENSLILAAKLYQNLGYKVLPIKADSKKPKCPWSDRPDFQGERLERFFSTGKIALLGGVDNLVCLDFDLKNIPDEPYFMMNVAVAIPPELYAKLVIQRTPSGGCHFLVKSPYKIRNRQLAKTKDGKVIIETRGDGGYFLVDPSEGYRFEQGCIVDIPTLSESEWLELIIILKEFDQRQPEVLQIRPPLAPKIAHKDSPFAYYNEYGDPNPIIRSFGFQETSHDHVRLRYKHPLSHGDRCANWHTGLRKFYVFSTSIPQLDSNEGYTLYDLLVILSGEQEAISIVKDFMRSR